MFLYCSRYLISVEKLQYTFQRLSYRIFGIKLRLRLSAFYRRCSEKFCQNNHIIRDAVLRDSPGQLHSLRIVIALQATDRSGDRFALMRRTPSGVDGLPDKQVLRELLALDAAAVARDHPEAGV